jgi:PIN domain nuclease of toxin-antitoxin system
LNVLLDTHTLMWFYTGDAALSTVARATIQDPANNVFGSPATYWEMAIKIGIGKLVLAEPFLDFVQHSIADNGFQVLPIEPRHCDAVIGLPYHHRDPFDRIMIAQAIAEGMPLLSADGVFDSYPVQRIW